MKGIMAAENQTRILVQKAQQGDQAAVGELFEVHRARLAGLILSLAAPQPRGELEVDEVLQETFSRALDSLERFQWHGEDSFIRWLGGIAHNVLRKRARRESKAPTLHISREHPASGISPSKAMRRDERFLRLQKALVVLTAEQREVVRMARIDGMTINEIAAATKRKPNAVKQLILRGLRKLRDQMGETESLHLPDRPLDFEDGEDAKR